jgi:acyl-coenzyme A thioesterase PaaI-like protein
MQKYIDYLFNNPTGGKLFLITKVFNNMIPFNRPHGFKFKKVSDQEISIELPYKRVNKNHLGGMHACAIATLGEYCAGVLLLKNLGVEKYRFILANLQVNYHYQGRMKLTGSAKLNSSELETIKNRLLSEDKIVKEVATEIYDSKNNHVATVKSEWQVKSWDKVKTK